MKEEYADLKKAVNDLMIIQSKNYYALEELIFAENFHDVIKGSKWFHDDVSISPCRWAMGYPALYILYRILNETQPKDILEIGLGISTKIITEYAAWKKECTHRVVEHNDDWIDFFSRSSNLSINTNIVKLPIKTEALDYMSNVYDVTMYDGFCEKIDGLKFDFICIDGPYGSKGISRIDILAILPECLKKEFVIMLDDCEREGEKNTLNLLSQRLTETGIEHSVGFYMGEKGVGIIMSKNLAFLGTL